MPMLRNLKRERFCQEILRNGGNASAAYAVAYGKTGHVAEACGSRLLNFAEVRERLSELSRPAERKARLDAASLLDEMASVIADAKASQQHGVRVTAATLAAKIQGMFVEKLEIGGVGAFGLCDSPQDVARKMIRDADGNAAGVLQGLDQLRQTVIEVAAAGAKLVN